MLHLNLHNKMNLNELKEKLENPIVERIFAVDFMPTPFIVGYGIKEPQDECPFDIEFAPRGSMPLWIKDKEPSWGQSVLDSLK